MKKIILIAAMAFMSVAAMAQNHSNISPDALAARVDSLKTNVTDLDAAVTMLIAQNLKYGYVVFDELVWLSPAMDEATKVIEENRKVQIEMFEDMYREYEGKVQAYQQNGATWTPAVREMKEKELRDIQARLEQTQQSFQQELQVLTQQQQQPVYEAAQTVVRELAKAKGLAFVFDKNSLLYLDPAQGVDLTPEARAALKIPADRTLEKLEQEMQAKAQAAAQGN
jgi:outer membrane protein